MQGRNESLDTQNHQTLTNYHLQPPAGRLVAIVTHAVSKATGSATAGGGAVLFFSRMMTDEVQMCLVLWVEKSFNGSRDGAEAEMEGSN